MTPSIGTHAARFAPCGPGSNVPAPEPAVPQALSKRDHSGRLTRNVRNISAGTCFFFFIRNLNCPSKKRGLKNAVATASDSRAFTAFSSSLALPPRKLRVLPAATHWSARRWASAWGSPL